MSTDGSSSAGRPQLLIIMAAGLILLAAIACVVLPLMHVSAALAAPIALMALIPIVLLLSYLRRIGQIAFQAQRAAEVQRLETDRNQQAIMRLLDEMSNLAEGDLTVQATVTEDITGAIADSVNYAVEALRKLVATISQSGIQLDGAARQTQALASHLARASSAQSKQIGSATESIGAMASSIEEVSGNAERGADVARHSVDVAHKGGDAVRRTIDGMNAIRETIQETSKRIKRLGESSQEIGNIVELISDIAEQTNILALNASIQASMAGEAGRGFAVVADEVQRLAERAANATKQIEALVRTIQADTNEAVVSMERSTTDVVGGALLAENAGAALQEIEQVSNQIASLVQNISASARGQSTVAQNIARNMQVLREISAQSADSTSATSQAIAKLADLSASLRKSISGFRLPGSTADSTGMHRAISSSVTKQHTGMAATAATKSPTGNVAAAAPAATAAPSAYSNPKVKMLGGS
jgi:twitching motility protein PilJ